MADSTSNTPRTGWNAPNIGPVTEHATIGSSIVIKGEVSGSEALFIDGTVEGTIRIPDHRVTVGRESHVTANITAREVVVMGTVKGDIHCADLLDIRAESNIQGEIVTRRIRIDDGAVLRGSVEIQKPEKSAATAESVTAEAKPRGPAVSVEKKEELPVAEAKETAKQPEPERLAEPAKEEVVTSALARRMGAASGGWFKSGR